MKKIAVLYLCRKDNNKDSFFNFLNSYKSFESGIEHDFYIILKGYKESDDISWIKSELKNIDYSFIYCIDKGFDIYAYFYSSKKVKNKYVMFINSFSQINCDDWLFNLFTRLSESTICVGCSGSWESLSSTFYYKRIYHCTNYLKKIFNAFIYLFLRIIFPKFPNIHLRTNSFIINRKFFIEYNLKRAFKFKVQAWHFESGRRSLTNFIKSKNKNFGIVDKNANFYDENNLNKSNVYAKLNESTALIIDNQILSFGSLNLEQKKIKSYLCWDFNKLYYKKSL